MTRTADLAPLAGRRALVTGAAQGLGRAFAAALAEAGAAVAACDVREAVHDLRDALARHGVATHTAVSDVSDPAQVLGFVDGAAHALGGLDIVVNNAGVVVRTDPASDSWERAVADFETVTGVNYRGAYLVGRAAIPHLIAAGCGDIVNVTTDHIHTCGYPEPLDHADAPGCPYATAPRPPLGGPGFDVYDSSKWAIKGLTNVWARDLAPHAIRVNSLGMGSTDTPMYRRNRGERPLPPGLQQPEDVAAVLVALLAEGRDGRTADDVQMWLGHPCCLGPPGLEARLAQQATA